MRQNLFSLVVPALSLASTVSAWGPPGWPSCGASPYYQGWASMKYAFVFGDSYTTTGFNDTGVQPTVGNPLGNPTYPGYTATDGPNWVDYLTVQYNESTLLTYNLAYGGATVDSALVAPYLPTVLSVAQQVQDEFFPVYAGSPAIAPWCSSDALFAIFIGINDVGNSYGDGVATTTTLNKKIFAVYQGLVDSLYYAGGRNFLFLTVPAVDRSPLTTGQGNASVAEEHADILAFNAGIQSMAESFKHTYEDANVFVYDTYPLWTEVLNNPASFPQTAQYKNTTEYCDAYANGTPTETYFNATCGIPVQDYFWLNSLHPTYPMMNVLAEEVSKLLEAGPNVC